MKVVFCCLNSKYIHSSLAPWCLFAACKTNCSKDTVLSVCEGTINESTEQIEQRILAHSPDVISFSCYIWNIKMTLLLAERIKQLLPDVKIILGGPEVAYNVQSVFKCNPCVDFVCSGQGEEAVSKLINRLQHGCSQPVDGISERTQNGIHVSETQAAADCGISPFCEEYLQNLNGRIAYMESSRGCPFRCAFCLSGRLGNVQYIDMERVKKEMLLLANSGTKTVKFVDRTFNCNKQRAAEILNFILENHGKNMPSDVCFHFEIAADLLDENLFSVIEKLPVGSVQFEVGIQSFNKETLQKINRKTDLEKVENNVRKLLSFGNCHIHIDLIAGLPAEDFNSFVDGFNRAYAIKANMLQLGFLKLLHGSDMLEKSEFYPCNHCTEPPYEVIDTPWITQNELQKLHTAENELERLYNSGRFRRTLNYLLSASGLTPFDLFFRFGTFLKEQNTKSSVSLDAYTELVFSYFSSLSGVDKLKLRDCMIFDRIATNNSGRFPDCLKIADDNLKKVKRNVLLADPVVKGTNRSVAILYSENKIIYCDYLAKNIVTGEYEVKMIDL